MTGANPVSIPGGWNKDSPAVEKPDPDTQSVPRSAAGTVKEGGEIVDDKDNTIGKVAEDAKDPQELVGNTVTTAGDIVNSSGEVLGEAIPEGEGESEYTTKEVEEGNDSSSGFNILGRTKGMFAPVSNSLFGSQKSKDSVAPSETGELTEKPQEKLDDATDAQNAPEPISLDDKDPTEQAQGLQDKADDVQKSGEDATGDAQKTGEDAAGDVQQTGEDAAEDAQKTGEDAAEDAQKTGEDAAEDVQKPGDEATGDLEDKTEQQPEVVQSPAPIDADNAKETAEGEVDDAKKTGEEALPEGEDVQGKDTVEDGEKAVEGEGEKVTDEAKDAAEGEQLPEGEKLPEGEELAEGAKDAAEGDKLPEGEQAEGEEEAPLDYSALKGTKVNKAGNLVNENGDIIGRVVEGEVKQLLGKRADENGDIWNDSGKKVGRGEPLPDGEREDLKKDFAPFENFPDAVVEADGKVTSEGRQVGVVIEGDPKRLKGSKVDEDGDILDRRGNVVGKAEAWDEPEPIPEAEVDKSILAGKRVNKAGNVVSSSGEIFGRVIEGNVSALVGRMCDKDGNVRSESGDIIGKAEVIPEGEREGTKEGPFAELSGCTVAKDGKVVTPAGDVVGRLVSGDPKVLFGRSVDEDGDVVDRNGNVLAKAERWEEPEVEKKRGPMAGRKVNREGNILDDDGNVMGKLISGDVMVCSGKEVDDDGDVINSKGNTVGHVVLIEDIPPEPEPEESAEDKTKREQAEKDKKLAGQLSGCIEQSLDKIKPICKMITDKIDRAERTPKEELDEEELVKQVKPLIEEGGKILTETNGVIRGLDPDGRIQKNAKHKAATREATPEEFHLADVLKELTGTVTECIDNAKRKIEDMPHAKEELNPLWGLLAEPLFQILAAVGLLLNGVLGLVGRLLSGLGLGGLVDSLLGGLGVDKLLDSLGLGSVVGSLTGKKDKKK